MSREESIETKATRRSENALSKQLCLSSSPHAMSRQIKGQTI